MVPIVHPIFGREWNLLKIKLFNNDIKNKNLITISVTISFWFTVFKAAFAAPILS